MKPGRILRRLRWSKAGASAPETSLTLDEINKELGRRTAERLRKTRENEHLPADYRKRLES